MAGPGGSVFIGAVALLIVEPKKLPEIGHAAGKTLTEFKNSTKGLRKEDDKETEKQSQTKSDDKVK